MKKIYKKPEIETVIVMTGMSLMAGSGKDAEGDQVNIGDWTFDDPTANP